MTRLPSFLEPVRTTATACPRNGDPEAAMALLEQARAGLLTTVVAREANSASMVRLTYRKKMNGNSDRAMSMTVRRDSTDRAASSFHAAMAGHDFVRRGFASGATTDQTYFGPDPDVILDDAFIAAYCFHVMKPDRERANQIGLGFAPATRAQGRIDIDGALWIDTVARALHDIEFRYLGFPRETDEFHPAGTVSFREMPNGVVLVDRWTLRLVGVEDAATGGDPLHQPLTRQCLFLQESGGELARATWPDGFTWSAPLGALRLHAMTRDSTPSAGTHVRLAGTDYEAWSDANGDVEIPDLVPGPYSLIVIDPALAEIGVDLDTPIGFVAARESIRTRTLTVPTIEDYARRLCGPEGNAGLGANTFILGRVMNPQGQPVDRVWVSLWVQFRPPLPEFGKVATYRTGSNGRFQFCPMTLVRHGIFRVEPGDDDVNTATRQLDTPVTVVRLTYGPPP